LFVLKEIRNIYSI